MLLLVAQVVGGLLQGHAGHVVADGDALVERGELAELEPAPQRGLSDQQAGEWGGGVHVVVGEHADAVELVVGEQVAFVDDQDGGAAAFGVLGGERVGGLGGEGGGAVAGPPAQGTDDGVVDAADADGGVADVGHGVSGWVQGCQGGAGGDGLADADLAGEHAEGVLVDAPGEAGDRFGVGGVAVQHLGGKLAAERHAGEPVGGLETLDHDRSWSGSGSVWSWWVRVSWPGIWPSGAGWAGPPGSCQSAGPGWGWWWPSASTSWARGGWLIVWAGGGGGGAWGNGGRSWRVGGGGGAGQRVREAFPPAPEWRRAGFGVDPWVVVGLHPGGQQAVQLGQISDPLGGLVVQLDQELLPHGAEESLNLAASLGSARGGVHQPDAKHRAGPQQPGVHKRRPVVHVDLLGHATGGQRGPQCGRQPHGVFVVAEPGAHPDWARRILATCAAVRCGCSRLSAAANASTSAGVRALNRAGVGTSASNPPARHQRIHRSMVCRDTRTGSPNGPWWLRSASSRTSRPRWRLDSEGSMTSWM